jgi:crotonobetainyl-CoA:carnitine CoA-transferase CaiB-like acyl-CoA transferase
MAEDLQQRIRQAEARLAALQDELAQLYEQARREHTAPDATVLTGSAPLAGVRIVDLSWAVFGPLSTQLLADMGAEVIKIERLEGGDIGRQSNSFYFTNRNKQSITVDLQAPEGREVVLTLAETANIFVQNFRPGVVERLGLDYDAVSRRNPRIVYCSLSGYGEDGPYRTLGGQDLILQGMSGMLSIIGWPDGPPTSAGFYACDITGAHYNAIAMLMGLYVQQQRGIGQKIELALLDCAVAVQGFPITWYLNHPAEPPQKAGSGHWTRRPLYGVYTTKDLPLTLVAGNVDDWWLRLTTVPGLESLAADVRFTTPESRQQHATELNAAFEALLGTRTRDEWMQTFTEARILCGPVYTYDDLFADPQFQHNNMVCELPDHNGQPMKLVGLPIRMHQTPGQIHSTPPALGQHTEVILRRLGYTPEDIQRLRQQKVVA